MRVRPFTLSLALLLALAPRAAHGGSVELETMTSPEVTAAIRAGMSTVIVPTGGTEQNGAHMVLGKHNLIVAEAARRIAARLGDALVAPVIAVTPEGDPERREGHMAHAGTLSMPADVFARVLEAVAQSLKTHGFKTIAFIGDSGPNQAPQAAVAAALSERWSGEGVSVLNVAAYYDPRASIALLEAEGETGESIGDHAGIRDTSELMAVSPSGIRGERLVAGAAGVSGDPARASAERGSRLLDLRVAAAVAAIRSPRASALMPKAAPGAERPSLLARLLRLVTG